MKHIFFSLTIAVGLLAPQGMLADDVQKRPLESQNIAAQPEVIPFELYQTVFIEYCAHQAHLYKNLDEQLIMDGLAGLFFSTVAVGGVWTQTQKVALNMHYTYNADNWKQMIVGPLCTLWAVGMGILGVQHCIACIKNLRAKGSLFLKDTYQKNEQLWHDRMYAPIEEQQKIWQSVIMRAFGNPTVIGHIPADTQYVLEFNKTNGIGLVTFDPFDREQVRALLGLVKNKKEVFRCTTLYIVATEE